MTTPPEVDRGPTLSIVVPVYQGADCLERLCFEIEQARADLAHDDIRLTEAVFVYDHGPDRSDEVLQKLEAMFDWVSIVWLSKNFGQHPATVAGIAATSGDWVITMDEDGLHDPAEIGLLLDRATSTGSDLVYGVPATPPPHPMVRNVTSALAKRIFGALVGSAARQPFASFRLLDGPCARNLVAYCGHDVYLDVALRWAVSRTDYQPVEYRPERRGSDTGSGYNMRKLISHFRRLVLSSGTRPLRVISLIGLASTGFGLATALAVVWLKLTGGIDTDGWASVMIGLTIFSGLIMMGLGIIAEYLSLAATMAVGRPLYLVSSRPPRHGQPKRNHQNRAIEPQITNDQPETIDLPATPVVSPSTQR